MLFLLTGDIQIGKTRWLQAMVRSLGQEGVAVHGVLAPGEWVGLDDARPSPGPKRGESLKKVAILNELLPQHESFAFATWQGCTQDALQRERRGDGPALGWKISDAALRRTDDHLGKLAQMPPARPGERRLLVIDEFGKLEIMAGRGLENALALVERGPSGPYPVIVAVVRESLLRQAVSRFDPAWPGQIACIGPNEKGLSRIWQALGF